MNDVYILNAKRTPIGSYLGQLSDLNAVELATITVKSIISNLDDNESIDRIYFGNVLSAGLGQNVARQIAVASDLLDVPSITVNRVCSSGLEAIRQGYNDIKLGNCNCIIAGGVESMSNSPYLNKYIKKGNKFGDVTLLDSMLLDGLIDGTHQKHMGVLAEEIIKKYNISRQSQDYFAELSYLRAREYATTMQTTEIVSITKKNTAEIISIDQEIFKPNLEKLPNLRPVFKGTITAGNASKLSDGASAVILISGTLYQKYFDLGFKPIKIVDFDLFSGHSEEFTRAPIHSTNNILKNNNININDIDLIEINEAFSSVPIMFSQYFNLDLNKINQYGGAISLGHPLGCSGNRIVNTLFHQLQKQSKKSLGLASICNGGGGATSILLEYNTN